MNSKYEDVYIHAYRDAKGVNQFYPGNGLRLYDILTEMSTTGILVTSWNNITGKPTFATVATTGSYNDLINKPVFIDTNSFTDDLVCTGNRWHDGGNFDYVIADLSTFDVSTNIGGNISVAGTGLNFFYDESTSSVRNIVGLGLGPRVELVFNEPVTGDSYVTLWHQDIRVLSQRSINIQSTVGVDVNGVPEQLNLSSLIPSGSLNGVPISATTGSGEVKLSYRKIHDFVSTPKGKTELILGDGGANFIFDKEGTNIANTLKINGAPGTSGQALISQGASNPPIWGTPTSNQVQTDWNAVSGLGSILNKPALAVVATSGNYNDLTNKPTIAGQINADWNATSGSAQILNKPSIPAAQVNSDWAATSGIAQIANKPVLNYATSEVDTKTTWIDGKPIYKLTITFVASNFVGSSMTRDISGSISGTISDVIDINTMFKASNDYYKAIGITGAEINKVTKIIKISNQIGLDGHATLYYTK